MHKDRDRRSVAASQGANGIELGINNNNIWPCTSMEKNVKDDC